MDFLDFAIFFLVLLCTGCLYAVVRSLDQLLAAAQETNSRLEKTNAKLDWLAQIQQK
jgi:hypothetical protein